MKSFNFTITFVLPSELGDRDWLGEEDKGGKGTDEWTDGGGFLGHRYFGIHIKTKFSGSRTDAEHLALVSADLVVKTLTSKVLVALK